MTDLIRVDPTFKKEIERIQAELKEVGLDLTIPQTTKLLVKTKGRPEAVSNVLDTSIRLDLKTTSKRKVTNLFNLI